MIDRYLELIESEIRRMPLGFTPKSLYDPIRYIMELGGKRLRPLLTLLAYSIYKTDARKVIRYAAAVEAFHNFTLMHDDIMDRAPIRRGKATVHEKWDINTAILSGDVMLVKVYEMFEGLDPVKLSEVLSLLNACAVNVCEGQQWDMEFEKRKKVTEDQYLEMIRLKTAVLLGFSLELGAVLADAPAADRKILRSVGTNLGISFQLKDDLLDAFADGKKFGKQTGGDILANKKTFLLIKAMERAKGKQKTELQKWLAARKFTAAKKVKAIKAIYESLNIPRMTETQIQRYFKLGMEDLERLSVKTKAHDLVQFALSLAGRQK